MTGGDTRSGLVYRDLGTNEVYWTSLTDGPTPLGVVPRLTEAPPPVARRPRDKSSIQHSSIHRSIHRPRPFNHPPSRHIQKGASHDEASVQSQGLYPC